ncbi:MAG: MBL fold metallo-hydrolase [Desulfurococcales archaeon]|nr:MBL fold metallo-hydrolase [Desulfurococcales archaeon]
MAVKSLKLTVLVEDYAGYGSKFWGQHGISVLAEAETPSGTYKVLFDTGTSHEPVLHNAELLGVKLGDVDYVVISHNHYDHTGGLPGLAKVLGEGTPVIAHPEIFKVSYAFEPHLRYIGPTPNPTALRRAVEDAGLVWLLSKNPMKLFDGAYTTGEIPPQEREGFERDMTITVFKEVEGKLVRDLIEDEIGLAFVTDEGLVVLGGCSHPGIVSIVKKAMEVTGVKEVRAVIGGFHLISASEERIDSTVKAFQDLGVKEVYAGHCTGLRAEAALQKAFGTSFKKLHSGMRIRFG